MDENDTLGKELDEIGVVGVVKARGDVSRDDLVIPSFHT